LHFLPDCWSVWEDERFLAFLTPFPNTPGFTVVVPKRHMDSDVLSFTDTDFSELLQAAKHVSDVLKKSLGVRRVGLVVEGMGVDHAHIKLIPMHGIPDGPWKPILSEQPIFSGSYQGYLSTHDGPRMSNEELDSIQAQITSSV
jgi:histidine triad (HIT) family protein